MAELLGLGWRATSLYLVKYCLHAVCRSNLHYQWGKYFMLSLLHCSKQYFSNVICFGKDILRQNGLSVLLSCKLLVLVILHSEASQKNSRITFSCARHMEKAVSQEKQMVHVRRKSYKAACSWEPGNMALMWILSADSDMFVCYCQPSRI